MLFLRNGKEHGNNGSIMLRVQILKIMHDCGIPEALLRKTGFLNHKPKAFGMLRVITDFGINRISLASLMTPTSASTLMEGPELLLLGLFCRVHTNQTLPLNPKPLNPKSPKP